MADRVALQHAWLNLARLVLSQSCSVFGRRQCRLSIISLMLSLERRDLALRHSTVIERVRSPFVTAVGALGDGAHLR